MFSGLKNTFFNDFIPKGKAWGGANTTRLIHAVNVFWEEAAGFNLFRFKRNQNYSSAEKNSLDDFFNDLNYNPRIFSSEIENKLIVIDLFNQPKRWITTADWVEIANRLSFDIEIVTGDNAFNNPGLISPTPPPLSERNGRYILFIKLIPQLEPSEGFTYIFDFTFLGEINSGNLLDLYRNILNNNVELRTF